MDGTLVDTEPYWIECEKSLVAAHDGTWSDADAHSIIGFDLLDSAAELRDRGGVDLDPVVIVERLLECVVAKIRHHLPWRPGARELLSACRAEGVPCALVTMSWRSVAQAVVDAAPDDSFAVVVTGDAVTRGKPDPEPYLTAAAMLGVEPARCVAIEDSPTGTAAALAAGCATLGVPHVVDLAPRPDLTLAPSLTGIRVADLGRLVAD
jgi:HAD superfamily hydrolase (TIGR01509 family)